MNILMLSSRVDRYPIDLGAIYSAISDNTDYNIFTKSNLNQSEVAAFLLYNKIDVLLLCSNNSNIELIKYIRKVIKRRIRIIVGGLFFVDYEAGFLAMGDIDYGIYGCGEETIIELLNYIQFNLKDNLLLLSSIKGLVYRDDLGVNFTGARLVDLSRYSLPNMKVFNNPNPSFLGIRCSVGCYYKCNFCSPSNFSALDIKVLADIVVNEYNDRVNTIMFYGNFYYSNIDIRYLIDKLKENNIKVNITLSTTINRAKDESTAKLYKELGVTHLFVGLESIHEEILEYYNKKINIEDINACINTAKKYRLNLYANILIGSKKESVETVSKSLEFVKNYNENNLGSIRVARVELFPGSKFYRDANLPLSTRIKQLITNKYEFLDIEPEALKLYQNHRIERTKKAIVDTGTHVKCPICSRFIFKYNSSNNYCWNCGYYISSLRQSNV